MKYFAVSGPARKAARIGVKISQAFLYKFNISININKYIIAIMPL
jgi:hypothetical protein